MRKEDPFGSDIILHTLTRMQTRVKGSRSFDVISNRFTPMNICRLDLNNSPIGVSPHLADDTTHKTTHNFDNFIIFCRRK